MMKAMTVRCIQDSLYQKTNFIKDEIYFAYLDNNHFTVTDGQTNKGFCNIETCMLKHGHPYGFQKHFEIIEVFFVSGKKEFKSLVSSRQSELV